VQKITPDILLNAYSQGYFPMASPEENWAIHWYRPDPRTILPLDKFRVSKSLGKRVRSGHFEMRINSCFEDVMIACSESKPGRETTWISEELIQLYTSLHNMGFAHSVETWRDGKLQGGLYGVSIGGAFFGESMFHRETDASKVALVHLIEHMRNQRMILLDVQYSNPHLEQFGIIQIPSSDYELLLEEALSSQSSWSKSPK